MILGLGGLGFTQRPRSSSFWGLPYRVLNMNHKKDLLRSLWVGRSGFRIVMIFAHLTVLAVGIYLGAPRVRSR